MADNTLTGRCMAAYTEAVNALNYPHHTNRSRHTGIRAVIEHIAAELTVMGHIEAGRSLLAQLNAQVIPFNPTKNGPA